MKGIRFEIRKLTEAVENSFGKKVSAGSDFEKLAVAVWNKCEEHLSPSAISRLWNLITIDKPKRETLDKLSLFVGFQNWEAFRSALYGESDGEVNYSSGSLKCDEDIDVNDKVTIVWQPMNRCVARYLGHEKFVVVSSDSPMLNVGDTFECSVFVTGKPLHLKNFVHDNSCPTELVVGGKNGISASL
jgi:hypothetical protein